MGLYLLAYDMLFFNQKLPETATIFISLIKQPNQPFRCGEL